MPERGPLIGVAPSSPMMLRNQNRGPGVPAPDYFWEFEEASGNRVDTIQGAILPPIGTVTRNTAIHGFGMETVAAVNGNRLENLALNPFPAGSAWSFCLWHRRDPTFSFNGWGFLLSIGDALDPNLSLFRFLWPQDPDITPDRPQFQVARPPGIWVALDLIVPTVSSVWYRVMAAYDGVGNVSVWVQSQDETYDQEVLQNTGALSVTSTPVIRLHGLAASSRICGITDHLKIWSSVALTKDQLIAALANPGVP